MASGKRSRAATPAGCDGGSSAVRFEVGGYDRRRPLVIDPVLAYSTFLGGIDRLAHRDRRRRAGNAYVTGDTASTDFPTTPGAFDTTLGGSGLDAFVTKLNADGSALVYSTFLGGSVTTAAAGSPWTAAATPT